MIEEKKGMHRAYFVFAGVCALMAGGMGLVLNVVGNFFPPISQAVFGTEIVANAVGDMVPAWTIHIPEVTIIMTVYSYVMLVWLPFAGQLFDRIDGRVFFGAAGIILAISTALMGVWEGNIFLFYISAAGWGLAGPILFLVGPSVLINNWFAPHKAGRMLGIASAFTGFGAFVWSPTFAQIITTMGYKVGFFIEAGVVVVLIVLPAIFLFRVHPEDMGLKPCGADDPDEIKAKSETKATGGLAPKAALATVAFYLVFIAACIISLGGGFKSTMPAMVTSTFGGPDTASELYASYAAIGALMISTAAVGNILGKIFLGFLTDKIGITISIVIFVVLAIIGFVCLIISGGSNAILLVGGFGIGTADALMSVGLPLVTRTVFGLKHYAKIYSFINMGIAVLGGLGATYVSLVNTLTGSYTGAYITGIIGFVIVCACLIGALANAKSFRNKWEE
jgi:MFS family permease